MSLAIDAVILFSAVIIVWLGAKRGLIRSVMGLVSGIVSAIAAYAYTPVLAAYIRQNYLIDNITNGIAETLRSLAFDTSTDLYDLDRLAVDLPEPFTGILERYNIDIDAFSEQIRGLTGCSEEVVNSFAGEIASPTADLIASVAAFAILFVVILIVLSLLTAVLDLIFTLPVLRSANMFFGFLLGLAEAAFFASILATVMSVLVSSLGAIEPSLFGSDAVEDTVICQFVLRHNLVNGLMTALGWG